MLKNERIFIVCLTVILALMLAGCAKANDLKSDNSSASSTVSNVEEKSDVDGIELPEEEFTSSQQAVGSESDNTSQEKNDETSSSAQENGKEETSASDGNPDKESASSSDDSHEDTSSDVTSVPSESQDGSLELPMDKW